MEYFPKSGANSPAQVVVLGESSDPVAFRRDRLSKQASAFVEPARTPLRVEGPFRALYPRSPHPRTDINRNVGGLTR